MMPLRPYLLGGAAAGALIAGVIAAFLSITALVSDTSFPGATELRSARPDTLKIDASSDDGGSRALAATGTGLPTTVASVGLAPGVLPPTATGGSRNVAHRAGDDSPSARGAGGGSSGSSREGGSAGGSGGPADSTAPLALASAPSGATGEGDDDDDDDGEGGRPPDLADHSGDSSHGHGHHSGGAPRGGDSDGDDDGGDDDGDDDDGGDDGEDDDEDDD
jgi:hypothetical protein